MGILTHLRAHETASPSEIAGALDLPLATVSYHVRKLDEIGLVDFVAYAQRRGAIQHFYALSAVAVSSELVRELTARTGAEQGEPSRADARALLDATAIGELRAELRHLFARLRELEAETVRRTGVKSHARTFAVEVSCIMDGALGSATSRRGGTGLK